MRIGLITDTHIPDIAEAVPAEVAQTFQGVELILHAGDIYDLHVLNELEQIAPVLAALGDDDAFRLLQDKRVEMKHVLTFEGHTVWLVHEKPLLYRLTPQQAEEMPDVVVHGHSHTAKISDDNGTLFIGSGSPTFLNYRRGLGTVAILDITDTGVDASIVRL
ncbi:MAG: metallophosphoesterase family protein [Dehalococcoidales bacterium]|nr:MAG: metallophosphoesterase family protein [Dehalococcoidales bacterium]